MEIQRVKVLIEGRVQGVGYRMYVRDLADRYKVTGWVRNRINGSVEAEIEGKKEIVQRVVDGLYARESPVIRVGRITVSPMAVSSEHGFEIR